MPKSNKVPSPDDDDVWTDAPENKAPAETPLIFGNILWLKKEGDNGIITLIEIVDHEGVQTYLIETVDGIRLEVNIHNLEHPEDPEIVAITSSSSDYIHEFCNISEKKAQHAVQP